MTPIRRQTGGIWHAAISALNSQLAADWPRRQELLTPPDPPPQGAVFGFHGRVQTRRAGVWRWGVTFSDTPISGALLPRDPGESLLSSGKSFICAARPSGLRRADRMQVEETNLIISLYLTLASELNPRSAPRSPPQK